MKNEYYIIACDSLRPDTPLTFNVFERVKTAGGDKFILCIPKNSLFTADHRKRFTDNNIKDAAVLQKELAQYRLYLETHLSAIVGDHKIERVEKARILYDAAQMCIANVFNQPNLPKPLKSAAQVVSNITSFLLGGRHAFMNLFRQNIQGYYIYGHSAKVCIYSVALARKIGVSNARKLLEIGIGAFLHDVGMRELPSELFLKPTGLTQAEWGLVKRHPHLGSHILNTTKLQSVNVITVIRQHHEKLDGSGYPWGLKKTDIHPYARLACIADVFDALTSPRPYRPTTASSFDALREMRYEMGDLLDQELLEHFIRLMAK